MITLITPAWSRQLRADVDAGTQDAQIGGRGLRWL
jgi:hypothetical protein